MIGGNAPPVSCVYFIIVSLCVNPRGLQCGKVSMVGGNPRALHISFPRSGVIARRPLVSTFGGGISFPCSGVLAWSAGSHVRGWRLVATVGAGADAHHRLRWEGADAHHRLRWAGADAHHRLRWAGADAHHRLRWAGADAHHRLRLGRSRRTPPPTLGRSRRTPPRSSRGQPHRCGWPLH
jgi:hypothetical protein